MDPQTFCKYYFITLCAVLSYVRIWNLKSLAKIKFWGVAALLSVPACALIAFLRGLSNYTTVPCLLLFLVFLFRGYHHSELRSRLIGSVLALGITYAANWVSTALILAVQFGIFHNHDASSGFSFWFLVGGVQLLLILLLFRIPRLRNGFPFLTSSEMDDVGIYISCTLFIIPMLTTIVEIDEESHLILAVVSLSLLLLLLGLGIWTRTRMKLVYREKVLTRELEDLRRERSETLEKWEALREENESLSAIIHKDNKLIPATDRVVKEFLCGVAGDESCPATHRERASHLLAQLDALSRDRAGTVESFELRSASIPAIGIPSIDAMLSHMSQRAAGEGILFDVCTFGAWSGLPEGIAEADLSSLLADLTENAILATSSCERKRILVGIGETDGIFCLSVYDSGIPFPAEIAAKRGTERITTRRGSGGSGIGMMNAAELCSKYRASFSIMALPEDGGLYTKCISVRLDGKNEVRFALS